MHKTAAEQMSLALAQLHLVAASLQANLLFNVPINIDSMHTVLQNSLITLDNVSVMVPDTPISVYCGVQHEQ